MVDPGRGMRICIYGKLQSDFKKKASRGGGCREREMEREEEKETYKEKQLQSLEKNEVT